jgi:hypothetical protein
MAQFEIRAGATPIQVRCSGCHSRLFDYVSEGGVAVITVKHCGRDAVVTIALDSHPERPVARLTPERPVAR